MPRKQSAFRHADCGLARGPREDKSTTKHSVWGHRQNEHEHQKHKQGEDEDTDFGMQLPEGSGAILTVTEDTPGYRLGAQQVCNRHGNKCE